MPEEKTNNPTERRYRKVRTGIVTSDKMDKTVIVAIERTTTDPRFHKRIRVSKKVAAHDENNECKVGDKVQIIETRPLSKRKHWRVQKREESGAKA